MSLDSRVTIDMQDARYFEYAERNGAALMGLNVAVLERLQGGYVDECGAYRVLLESLKERKDLQLIMPGECQHGIISFFHESISAPEAVSFFRGRGVNGWAGYSSHTPGYMICRAPERFVRISLGCTSTIAQVEQFLRLLQNMND